MSTEPDLFRRHATILMPALSLKQPWASLVIKGHKTLESRMWATKYRGPLVICASLKVDPAGPWRHPAIALERLPVGQALGWVSVDGCRDMTPADEPRALCPWNAGRQVFELSEPRAFREPFAAKGMLGIFKLEMSSAAFAQWVPS